MGLVAHSTTLSLVRPTFGGRTDSAWWLCLLVACRKRRRPSPATELAPPLLARSYWLPRRRSRSIFKATVQQFERAQHLSNNDPSCLLRVVLLKWQMRDSRRTGLLFWIALRTEMNIKGSRDVR